VNVYDFDNTIYDGESVVDFFLFCLRKQPKLFRYVPLILKSFIRYKRCLISLEELEAIAAEYAMQLLDLLDDLDGAIREFWDRHEHKIKPFYKEQKRSDDLILSASAGFLLREIFSRIGIQNYVCSELNLKTRTVEFICYHKNKVKIFQEHFGDTPIEAFYTDSMNDLPMIERSEHAFLVKGKKIKQIK